MKELSQDRLENPKFELMHEVDSQDFEYTVTTQRSENVSKRILGDHLRLIIDQMVGGSLTMSQLFCGHV